MSPDAREEDYLEKQPKFRAVIPPELEGIPDEPFVQLDWDVLEAELEALEE